MTESQLDTKRSLFRDAKVVQTERRTKLIPIYFFFRGVARSAMPLCTLSKNGYAYTVTATIS